jgi:AcrR family transcriptional regulator
MASARDRRREAMIDDVVDAAWALVHEHGLAGLSMRELGQRVGLHASSIYQYFPSKLDIYDALFAHGHRQLQEVMTDLDRGGDPITVLRTGSAMFIAFCTEDPIRYQLLFQRTIPDFEPSAASMALAWESYQDMASALAGLGIVEGPDLDLWTAVQMGITDQQIANDPGGQRWTSQLDRAIDMFLAFVRARPPRKKA